MKPAKINIGFSGYSDTMLENKAASILQCMTGNPYFTSPIPTLAELTVAVDAYSTALVTAAGLGRVNVAEKNKTRESLELLLTQLGMYVMYIANGDVAILTSSGYPLRKTGEPRYLDSPGSVELENGITSGELVVSIVRPKGVVSFLHEVTPDPLTPDSVWQSTPGSRASFTFKNLEAGRKYWFRVAAVGNASQLAYSASACQFVQ